MTASPGRPGVLGSPAVAALALAVLGFACTPHTSAPASGATGPSGPSAPSGVQAALPASPQPLPGLVVEARLPGGVAPSPVDLAGGTVDPASSFEVRVAGTVRGARLVLLDAQDAMVPATSESEIGPVARFTLVPLEPLRPGTRYRLRLEGADSRLVASGDGRSFEPADVPLTTSGAPPPRSPPRKAVKKRKH